MSCEQSRPENDMYNMILFVGMCVCICVSFEITSMLRVVLYGCDYGLLLFFALLFCFLLFFYLLP